jgi:hypothetical protein
MQLKLVRPHTKDSIVPLSGALLTYFAAANMRTFRTWKLPFAAGFGDRERRMVFQITVSSGLELGYPCRKESQTGAN